MSTLAAFETNIVLGVVKDHAGHPVSREDWSGFASVRKEGGSVLYSASLKRRVPSCTDPKDIKPYYQRQVVTGFALQYVESITAIHMSQTIERVQLVYKFMSSDEIKNQIDRLTTMLHNVYSEEL